MNDSMLPPAPREPRDWSATIAAIRALGAKPAHVARLVARIEAGPPLHDKPPDMVFTHPSGGVVLSWLNAKGRACAELETTDDPDDLPEGYYWWTP